VPRREPEWAHGCERCDDPLLPNAVSEVNEELTTPAFIEAWTSSQLLGEAGPFGYARGGLSARPAAPV
jgi:hypothetical protein